jgi:23S rRNA (uracil1939-C5)-methyltransferase
MCHFHAADAARFPGGNADQWDAVLVDPPRTGLPLSLTKRLVKDPARALIYVSCDPGTLARDLALLVKGGYLVERAELFDMFPQTPHAEVLVVLVR